jgi:GAF domain-containing protein
MDFPVSKSEIRRLRRIEEGRFQDGRNADRLNALCTEAKAHFSVEITAITLLTRDDQILLGRVGVDMDSTPRSVAFCNYTILQNDIFVIDDTHRDTRFRDHPMTVSPPFVRFYAGAPLVYDADDHLGAFCLLDPEPRSFSMGDRAELSEFAERAMAALIDGLLPGAGQ